MKKAILLITVILLLSCLTVSAGANQYYTNYTNASTPIILENPPAVCHGPVIFTAQNPYNNGPVSFSCKTYNVCLRESEITQNCLSKSNCVVDYGYCSSSNYNNSNSNNGDNKSTTQKKREENEANGQYIHAPKEEPKKPPEFKDIVLTVSNSNIEHVQINTGIRVSESLITESYTSNIVGNSQIFNVNLQSITNACFEGSKPLTPSRMVKLAYTNNNDYPMRLSWDAESVKISNRNLPVFVTSGWIASTCGFLPERTEYNGMHMCVGNELISYKNNQTSGYIVIPPNTKLLEGYPHFMLYFGVLEQSNLNANISVDLYITRDTNN